MKRIVNRVPDLVAQKAGGKENINLTHITRETGLSYPTVSSWIKDQVVRFDTPMLLAWCNYLDCTPGDLLVIEEDGQ